MIWKLLIWLLEWGFISMLMVVSVLGMVIQ
jgi:hypothetical protein